MRFVSDIIQIVFLKGNDPETILFMQDSTTDRQIIRKLKNSSSHRVNSYIECRIFQLEPEKYYFDDIIRV